MHGHAQPTIAARVAESRWENPPSGVLSWTPGGDRDSPEGQAGRAAEVAAGPARRVPVPGRPRARDLRRQGEVDPQAGRVALRLGQRAERADRQHRVARRGDRGGGAARRAELHQAVPPAVQHPAARRQVLPVHRDQPGRGLPARVLHARAPSARTRLLRAVLQRQARARHARPARQDLPVPLLRGRRARPALGLAVPRLLHQALRGALRRLREQGGVPRGHRRRGRVPLRPLPPDRARPRAEDVLRRRRAGLRAGGAGAQPAAGRPGAAGAPARRRPTARGRSTRSPSRSTGSRPTRRSSRSATASSPTASPSTSTTRASSRRRSSPRSSCSSTTRARWRSRR